MLQNKIVNERLFNEWFEYFDRVSNRQSNYDHYGIAPVSPSTIKSAKTIAGSIINVLNGRFYAVSIDDDGNIDFSFSRSYGVAVIRVSGEEYFFIKNRKQIYKNKVYDSEIMADRIKQHFREII